MYMCMYICIHMCIYVYSIYICIYTYTHVQNVYAQGVGIEWDAYLLRSKTIGSSNIIELRVKGLDQLGPAYSSGRVRSGYSNVYW